MLNFCFFCRFILECSECGVIYKSRQSWYGNQGPVEAKAARVEIQHVWPGVYYIIVSFGCEHNTFMFTMFS